MLTIRNAQLAALRRNDRDGFVGSMVRHLREHFPQKVAPMNDGEVEALVQACIDRAAPYGLTTRRDVARLLNLQATYGWDLEAAQPWTGEMLRDARIPTPSGRLDRLVKESVRRLTLEENNAKLRRAFGVSNQHV